MSDHALHDTLARTAGPPTVLIVSDSYLGPTLAAEFEPDDEVRLVTDDAAIAARTPDDVGTTVGDVTAVDTLDAGGDADAAIVGLRTDRETLLVTQLLRVRFDIETTVVVLNNPDRHDAMSDVATSVVFGPECLSAALRRTVRPTTAETGDR
ncbi:NAD-binding protein [Halobellus ruber]|uniref:NAD-binding protein n=1 Tax=Halobellus ruber TaxID=2761102 RepID=A0A7J9SHI1_9EURY|nr:NAD-binding protein [Halobellus ruber]MBB6645427.1 NAD-binding protein [Halobellus ruber]